MALAIIGVVALFLLGPHAFQTQNMNRGQWVQTLGNMRQLYLATQQMEFDRETSKDARLGWPGDTGGSFSNWTAQLLMGNYLSENDLCKLLSAPGVIVSPNNLSISNTTAVLVYAVSTNSPDNAVFLTTANFTNSLTGMVLDPQAKPYGNKAFIAFRKSGDGTIYRPDQAGKTNVVGSYVPICH